MKHAHISTVSKPIDKLIPHPQNPNTHNDRQISKLRHLIKTHGYSKGSVVYQLSTHYILAGHGVIEALKKEGFTHVDAVELDINDDKAKAFVVHPTEKRKFSIAELKRICAFPDDFELLGTFSQQWERLGNCVPPKMMYYISKAVQEGVLDRQGQKIEYEELQIKMV